MLAPLTRARPLLLLAALANGCAHATGSPAARETTFDEQEYAQYAYAGTGTISGQVVLRGHDGQIQPAQGSQVSLNPVTSYSTEWWNRTVVGGLNLRSADEREQKYLRTALTDAEGRFRFGDLPRGEYFVVAALNTVTNATGSSGPSNSMVGQRVHLTEGGKVDLVLNDVHRTVAFARGPGTSAAEPAQLFQAGTEGSTTPEGADSTLSGRAAPVPPPPITLHPGVRQALNDLTRLGVVAEYGEYRPGLLILVLGDGYKQSQSVEYNLGRLLKAYGAYLHYSVPPVLELWLNGEKIGEYTNQGLLLGPEFNQPR
ncbi:MAG TPA: hypothetical protein VFI77_09585 [Gemmatimonadales bacterium]|nr:hypothetical protein [Gemmatimonadales bacterium]